MTNCPPEATLRLIGTDAVGEATFAGLEGHVEHCPDCQKILEAATRAVPQATRASRRLGAPRRRSPVSSSSASLAGGERAWFTSPGNPR